MRARIVAAACVAVLGTAGTAADAAADTQIATTKRPTADPVLGRRGGVQHL